MDNPQYIEYLNTLGAEINVKSQLRTQTAILESEVDGLEKQEKTIKQRQSLGDQKKSINVSDIP